jgi:hypothetical protein
VIFDASKQKDGHADITKLIITLILNNNIFIQFMLKIRKIKLRTYMNVLYQDQEYILQNIQKGIFYTIVEQLTGMLIIP